MPPRERPGPTGPLSFSAPAFLQFAHNGVYLSLARKLVEPKDVVLAILGSSAGLGGFVLVFLGVIIASYESYQGAVPREVVEPYRTAGGALLATFALSLVSVAVCLFWLAGGGPADSYGAPIVLFVIQLVAVFGVAAWVTRMVLWR